jgi:hypothetical protein
VSGPRATHGLHGRLLRRQRPGVLLRLGPGRRVLEQQRVFEQRKLVGKQQLVEQRKLVGKQQRVFEQRKLLGRQQLLEQRRLLGRQQLRCVPVLGSILSRPDPELRFTTLHGRRVDGYRGY